MLLGPAMARAAEPITDPVGDAEPDIIAVTARTVGDAVVLDVELADDWPGDQPTGLFVWVETSHTPCSGWTAEYFIDGEPVLPDQAPLVIRGGDSSEEAWSVGLDYAIDGPLLTIRLPLSVIGNPETLLLHVRLPDDVPDTETGCIAVSLIPEAEPPDTAISSSTDISSLVMAGVGLLLAAALLLGSRRHPDRRS